MRNPLACCAASTMSNVLLLGTHPLQCRHVFPLSTAQVFNHAFCVPFCLVSSMCPPAAEAGFSWERAEGVPAAAAGTERPQEPLHLGHGTHILLHLCCATGCHIVVCLLPNEGRPPGLASLVGNV